MELLVTLIIFLIIIGVCFWATSQLAGAFGIPAPIVVVIQVVLVLIGLVYLLSIVRGGALHLP